MNKNITGALKCLKSIKLEYPDLNNTQLARLLAGGYNTQLYNTIVLLLNEVK